MDLFTLFVKQKAEKETEEYKKIVTDTELALQDKLQLDEPVLRDEIVSTIEGIDIGAIVHGIVRSIGVTLRNVVDTANSVSEYKYSNKVDINTIDYVNATSVGNYAMSGCISLTSVNVPSVTSVGSYAIQNCFSLTSVNMLSVTSVGSYAMQNCFLLTSVNMPVATNIGKGAMLNCISLKSVRLGASQVCTLEHTNAFANTPIANGSGYIYVPDELVEDYKVATNWSVYADQIRPMSEYREEEE